MRNAFCILIAGLALGLAACGGGGSNSGKAAGTAYAKAFQKAVASEFTTSPAQGAANAEACLYSKLGDKWDALPQAQRDAYPGGFAAWGKANGLPPASANVGCVTVTP
jgi:hypothetical protein